MKIAPVVTPAEAGVQVSQEGGGLLVPQGHDWVNIHASTGWGVAGDQRHAGEYRRNHHDSGRVGWPAGIQTANSKLDMKRVKN
jgi:hypothetical protein